MTWRKHFTYLALLYTFFEYRGAGKTKGTCVCTYGDEVYNLTPLQRTDGKPRFTIHGGKRMPDHMYGYNPCTSFIKTGKYSSCLNDTAICKCKEDGEFPINIGKQSTAECGTDIGTGTPHLKYYSVYGSEWYSTVTLICDWTKKTVEEATFVQDPNNPRNFSLSHICACAGGCPLVPVTTKPTPGTTTPTPVTTKPTSGTTKPTSSSTKTTTASYSAWKVIWEPVTIAAGSVVFVFIVISIVVIRLLLKRQNQPNDDNERRPLIVEEDSGIDESRNSLTKLNDTRNTENARYASLIKSASSSSCSNITVPNKDVFDKTGVASVSV